MDLPVYMEGLAVMLAKQRARIRALGTQTVRSMLRAAAALPSVDRRSEDDGVFSAWNFPKLQARQ
jgi:hypothetical protein